MALDDLLTKVKTGGKYDAKLLYETSESLSELEATNLQTTEGTKKYSKITGENIEKHITEETELRKKARITGGNGDLSKYIDKYFSNITEELSEEEQMPFALGYLPSQTSKNKKYETTRSLAKRGMEILKEIKNKPKEYLEKAFAKESPLMKGYMALFQQEYLQIQAAKAERVITSNISNYGVENFLSETKQILASQNKLMRKEQESIMKEIETKKDEAKNKLLSTRESAELISKEIGELKKLAEKYPDAQNYEQFTGEIAQKALGSIKSKLEEKASETTQE